MANRINVPNSSGRSALLHQLPARRYNPILGKVDAQRVARIFAALPALEYPINSAGELLEKLGGRAATLTVAGRTVRPAQLVARLPAHYFPIASIENFAEKVAAVIRLKRAAAGRAVRVAGNASSAGGIRKQLERQLPPLKFPIRTADELVRALEGGGPYRFGNRTIQPGTLKSLLPARMFPLESKQDFYAKVEELARSQRASASASRRPQSTAHGPALAHRVEFGAAKARGPAMNTIVAREPGHVADVEHEGQRPQATAARRVKLGPKPG